MLSDIFVKLSISLMRALRRYVVMNITSSIGARLIDILGVPEAFRTPIDIFDHSLTFLSAFDPNLKAFIVFYTSRLNNLLIFYAILCVRYWIDSSLTFLSNHYSFVAKKFLISSRASLLPFFSKTYIMPWTILWADIWKGKGITMNFSDICFRYYSVS